MSFKISTYVSDLLKQYKKHLKGKNGKEIANFLCEKDNYLSDFYKNREKTLIRLIHNLTSGNGEKSNVKASTNKEPKELKTPYKVIGNKHYFYPIKGEFSLPNELVDELFYNYSEHGLNMSSTEMLLKYNLEPWQWHSVKSALRLYKKSHIFSPYTVQNTTPEELKDIIEEKMNQRINTVGFRVEQAYEKSIQKKYKEVINKFALRDLEIKTIITELFDLIPEAEIKPVILKNTNISKKEINVVLADIHFGAQNRPDNHHLPKVSIELLREQFDKIIIPTINSYGAEKVNIFLAGDLIESATGLNHIDSWKGIKEGYYGARLIKECYQFLVESISKIHNVNKIIGVAGNHDRMTSNKQEDTDGFVAELIFEFLQLSFRNTSVQVIFDNKLVNLEIDDIVYIMSHGHEKLTENGSQLVLKYGNQNKFNVLLSGHWHTRKIQNDTEIFRQLVCPSIFAGNNYSVSLGHSTLAGFLIVSNNGFGKPSVHDYPL